MAHQTLTVLRFPERLTFYENQDHSLNWLLPWGTSLEPVQPDAFAVQHSEVLLVGNEVPQVSSTARTASYELRLAGLIPLKKVAVEIIPELRVQVGGQSVGITIQPEGVMVVGFSPVRQEDGTWRSPGQEAGLKPGDQLLRIGNQEMNRVEEAARAIDAAARRGDPVQLTVRRNNEDAILVLEPIWDVDASVYRIGIVIRDETSGLGTLTFYSPDNLGFAALGHIVTEMDSQMPIAMDQGQIVQVEVMGIARGKQAQPGEKHGQKVGPAIGEVTLNSEFGVFGNLNQDLANPLQPIPLPVAPVHQVRTGPATLYTVLEGDCIQGFGVEIEQVIYQSTPSVKGLVLRITDAELLRLTGGIVQGMSGSPIVQNGTLVGAVTHVFVNDPTRGYGVFAEWMVRQGQVFDDLLNSIPSARNLAA